MTDEITQEIVNGDFDGFIMPDGETVSIKDYERMSAIFARDNEDAAKII